VINQQALSLCGRGLVHGEAPSVTINMNVEAYGIRAGADMFAPLWYNAERKQELIVKGEHRHAGAAEAI
jgi:hypothetical protein